MLNAFAVASVGLACACGGGSKKEASTPAEQPIENKAPPAAEPAAAPAPAPDSPEGAIIALEGFTAKMCTCANADCARQVSDDMTAWAQDSAKKHPEPLQMSEEQQKRTTEIGMRLGECMQKAMNAGFAQPSQP